MHCPGTSTSASTPWTLSCGAVQCRMPRPVRNRPVHWEFSWKLPENVLSPVIRPWKLRVESESGPVPMVETAAGDTPARSSIVRSPRMTWYVSASSTACWRHARWAAGVGGFGRTEPSR